MRISLTLFIVCSTMVCSQIKPKMPSDSLFTNLLEKQDSGKAIPIPNKKFQTYPQYLGLIKKSNGNTIPILNSLKIKDTVLSPKKRFDTPQPPKDKQNNIKFPLKSDKSVPASKE